MKILLPKTFYQFTPDDGPVFFLAGPIKGGSDWQKDCVSMIMQHFPDLHFCAVIPCRYKQNHPLVPFKISGEEDRFQRQTYWERHYLKVASERGCIIFWLPCESRTEPRTDGQPYAMDTRGEIGEWRGHLIHGKPRVVFGAEPGFPGLGEIMTNFQDSLGDKVEFFPTLVETVGAAINRARS
jgi:hypothetical protein